MPGTQPLGSSGRNWTGGDSSKNHKCEHAGSSLQRQYLADGGQRQLLLEAKLQANLLRLKMHNLAALGGCYRGLNTYRYYFGGLLVINIV